VVVEEAVTQAAEIETVEAAPEPEETPAPEKKPTESAETPKE